MDHSSTSTVSTNMDVSLTVHADVGVSDDAEDDSIPFTEGIP